MTTTPDRGDSTVESLVTNIPGETLEHDQPDKPGVDPSGEPEADDAGEEPVIKS